MYIRIISFSEKILTRNEPYNIVVLYWLGVIKPKSAFSVIQNTSNWLLCSLFFFLLTDWLTYAILTDSIILNPALDKRYSLKVLHCIKCFYDDFAWQHIGVIIMSSSTLLYCTVWNHHVSCFTMSWCIA